MIEQYFKIDFDVENFFGDYDFNKKTRDRLQAEKAEELTNSNASFSAARVSNSNISNPTEQKAKRRLSIDEKLKGLDKYFKTYDYIVGQLTDDETKIVKIYWQNPRDNNRIMKLEEALHVEQAGAYRKIREAKAKIKNIAKWL